jgi:hypothetical protein
MISRSAARKPFGLQMATEGPAWRGLPSDASEFFLRVEDGRPGAHGTVLRVRLPARTALRRCQRFGETKVLTELLPRLSVLCLTSFCRPTDWHDYASVVGTIVVVMGIRCEEVVTCRQTAILRQGPSQRFKKASGSGC